MVGQKMTIREKLDFMSGKIVYRFKERTDFKVNEPVYQADAIRPIDGRVMSLLEFSLEGIESYHASLGRYRYPDQFSLIKSREDLLGSKVEREVEADSLPDIKIDLKDRIIPQYIIFVKNVCEPGNDPSTYGATVYRDADLIQHINERINLGRYVAAAKLKADQSLGSIIDDRLKLKERLTDMTREKEVVENFKELATKYGLDKDFGEDFAMWLIQTTIGVEVDYIKGLVNKYGDNAAQKYKMSNQLKPQDSSGGNGSNSRA